MLTGHHFFNMLSEMQYTYLQCFNILTHNHFGLNILYGATIKCQF